MSAGLVRIVHRGGGVLGPENSLEGIESALGYGLEMVEVDVRRTLDGALVLAHDDLLHDGRTRVSASTLAELRAVGGVPTLDDALDLTRGRTRVNLDVKQPDVIEQLTEKLRERRALDGCIVSCLDAGCLARLAEMEPGLPRFFSYPPDYGGASRKPWLTPAVNAVVAMMRTSMSLRLRGMLRPLPGTGATIYSKLITRRLVDVAHTLGVPLYTWTVDDAEEMRRLAALGVDGITSNRPDLLAGLATARSRLPA